MSDFDKDNYYCLVVQGVQIYFLKKDFGDSNEEKKSLKKKLKNSKSQAHRIEKLLSSEFSQKAPKEIVEKEYEKLKNYKMDIEKIEELLK